MAASGGGMSVLSNLKQVGYFNRSESRYSWVDRHGQSMTKKQPSAPIVRRPATKQEIFGGDIIFEQLKFVRGSYAESRATSLEVYTNPMSSIPVL